MLQPPDPPLTDGVVVLRPFTTDDVPQIDAACQDLAIQQFIPIPRPYRTADAVAYVERTQRQWREGVKAAFAITGHDDPTHLLGAVNLAISGPCGNAAYWIVPGERRSGTATRALELVTDWALGTVGLGVVILEIHRANAASIRVAERAGFHLAGQLEVNVETGERNHLIFSRLAGSRAEPGRAVP
jgi:RimJ/RimL family protein N-acetyltransferase